MEFFDEEKKNNDMEERTKQKFMENYKKQLRYLKIILSGVFCGIGGVFLLLAIIFNITEPEDVEQIGVFLIMGIVFLIMGLIFLVVFSLIKVNEKTYNRMKKYQNKFGVMNIYSLSSTVTILNEQVAELTNKVEELEKELERVKRENRLNK